MKNKAVLIDVLANDTDANGNNTIVPRSVKVERPPRTGVTDVLQNGQVRYRPKARFVGTDSFIYTVKDNRRAESNRARVTITVQPANVPPVANNDSAATAANTPVTINVVANDTDANSNLAPATVAIVSNPANGTVVNNANGTVTYSPAPGAGFFGIDTFTYNVKDTQGATSNTATVTVGINAAPVANAGPDANAVTAQPVTLDGSASSDPNVGDTITFLWRFVKVPLGSGLTNAGIVNPTSAAPHFTPDVDGAYELELTVTDPGTLSDTDTVVITAATPNVAPNADAGPNQNANVLTTVDLNGSGSNDPDNRPNPLTYKWSFAQKPLGSTATIFDDTAAQTSFTPDKIGLYRLTLMVSDGDLSDSDDVDINVTQVNVAPNANAGADSVVQLAPPGQTATLDGSASNDPDNYPNPLTYHWIFVSQPAGSALANGDIVDASTATVSFTPVVPGVYLLRLDVDDGADTDFDEVMVKANAAPVPVDDPSYSIDEDKPLTVVSLLGVLANDTDANNDTLIAALNSPPSNAAPGSFTLNPDGSFGYTPKTDFNGTDSYTYHARDGAIADPKAADSNVATVTITVNPVNDAPKAVNDTYSVNEDNPLTGASVLANDTDVEHDPLTAVLNTGPTNAQSFTLNTDGTFSYTPNLNFFGTDTFTYHANDGNSINPVSNVATVTINVNAVNDAPSFTAGGDRVVNEDAGLQSGAWAAGISSGPANESGQTLTFQVSNNNNGLFSTQPAILASGVLTFTPAFNANGSATVMVTLQDSGDTANGGVNTSAAQGFTITVNPVNDPPLVTPPAAYAAHTHIGINVPDGATDLLDGSTITDADGPGATPFSITATGPFASANGGSVTIAGDGSFSYNPPAGFTGNDTFTYQICDSGVPGSLCTNATATVAVSGPRVWFVDNSESAGDGRLSNPFNTLMAADSAANAAGDRIFVSTGNSTYTGGFVMLTNQRLVGQGVVDSNFDTALGISPPANSVARPGINGPRPTINGTIALATGVTARGFNVSNTSATGVSGSGATGLTVNQVSVTTTTGTAVNLANASGTVSFTSVSANGAANGIVLNNTTGSFTVTGTGSAGSGGTIRNGGTGISLTSAQNVSLTRMQLNDFSDFAIRGSTVVNFTMDNTVINGVNGNNAVADEGSVRFTELTGAATISSSNISGGFEDNFKLVNTTGTLNRITFTNTTIGANSTTDGNDGINFETLNSAAIMATVQNCTFTASRGDLFQFNSNASSGATDDLIFNNNALSNNHPSIATGGGGTSIFSNGTKNFAFHIEGNSFRDALGHNVLLAKVGGTGIYSGTFSNNTIGAVGVANSGSLEGSGLKIQTVGGGPAGTGGMTVAVTGNTVRQYNNDGILFQAGGGAPGDGTGFFNVTATGNVIGPLGTNIAAAQGVGIRVTSGTSPASGPNPADSFQTCAQLGGAGALKNTLTGSGIAGSDSDYRVRQRFNTTVRLPGYGGAAGDQPAVANFIDGNNTVTLPLPAGTADADINDTPPTGGGFVGGAVCTQPAT